MGVIIVRYAELGLKGHNRIFFERRLVKNIKYALNKNGLIYESIKRIRGRILVYAGENALISLRKVFGISSLSYAVETLPDLDRIKAQALVLARQKDFETFRISVQNVKNTLKTSSMELEKQIGEYIYTTLKKGVSLKNPELNIQIEIADNAYIYREKIECYGGLPVGSEGRVLCLLEDKYSLLAAALVMKRGCLVYLCGKQRIDYEPLRGFLTGQPIGYTQIEDITELDRLASEKKALAIVVSDKLDSLKDYSLKTMILRPLAGYDTSELEKLYSSFFD